jgi:uncharacterized protein
MQNTRMKFMKPKYLLSAMLWLVVSNVAVAQLSSPLGGATGLPAGTGAGVHSPNSPFAPLPARADVLSWNMLADVKTKNVKGSIVPVFNAAQMALNQRNQRVQGFMMPLDPGEKQTHFILSSVPLSCGFCTPGGPESMVEVRTKTPVKYSMEPVVVEGNFQVLVNDQFGVYYKIVDANPVK